MEVVKLIEEFLPQIASFLFVFALLYGLLIYVKILPKNASALISLVIAFFAVMYSPMVAFLYDVLPWAAVILVVLFFLIFIKKLVIEEGVSADALPIAVTLAIMLLLVGIFWDKIGFRIAGITSENMLWIVGIIIVILLFVAIYSHKTSPTPTPRT